MFDHTAEPHRPTTATLAADRAGASSPVLATPHLFAWRGREILLFGERTTDRWIVARGWRAPDRLTDVRRWTFADPAAFARQIGRLVHDATDDRAAATLARAAAADWTTIAASG
jgi:hypothetical protein